MILELSRVGNLGSESCRRKIGGLSRFAETPRELAHEWTPGTAAFRAIANPLDARYVENWETVHAVLKARVTAATHKELLADWPADKVPPSAKVLYEWLGRGECGAGGAARVRHAGRAVPVQVAEPADRIRRLAPAAPALTRRRREPRGRLPRFTRLRRARVGRVIPAGFHSVV
jgi:hypothetical protein